jgi:hypothetical protein
MTRYIWAVGWLSCVDHVRPPFTVTAAPPSLPLIMMSVSSGLIHSAWWSTWASGIRVYVLPPSMDFMAPEFSTHTSSGSLGSATMCM